MKELLVLIVLFTTAKMVLSVSVVILVFLLSVSEAVIYSQPQVRHWICIITTV